MTSEKPDLLLISYLVAERRFAPQRGGVLEIKCILHAVVNSLCGLGSCPLVWHLHSVCLLHGHVAHSSHSAEEIDSRFASEWETHHLPLS